MFELLIDRALEDGRFVIVNCSNADAPRGTVFAFLQSRLVTRHGDRFESQPLASPEAVELEAAEIEYFRHSIDVIPGGCNAAVRFKGSGTEQLLRHLAEKQKSVQVILSSGRTEA
jgi:hypothetical protein